MSTGWLSSLGFSISDPTFTFPLDSFTGATAAYSLRKLRSAYAGKAVQLQRASDNATQDIGFSPNGNFDLASAITFLSGTTGGASKWYDQSLVGGHDLLQPTQSKQLQLVLTSSQVTMDSTGALVYAGHPVLRGSCPSNSTTASGTFMSAADSSTYKTTAVHMFAIVNIGTNRNPTSFDGGVTFLPLGTTEAWIIGYPITTSTATGFGTGSGFPNTQLHPWAFVENYSQDGIGTLGGTSSSNNQTGYSGSWMRYLSSWDVNFDTPNTDTFVNGTRHGRTTIQTPITYPNGVGLYLGGCADGSGSMRGDFAEIILYGTTQASRTSISANQSSYWGVTNIPTSLSTYLNGTTADGFTWTPVVFNSYFMEATNLYQQVIDGIGYLTETPYDYYSQWQCNNLTTGIGPAANQNLWRFEVRANDGQAAGLGGTPSDRSELDPNFGGTTDIHGNTTSHGGTFNGDVTVQISYSFMVEPGPTVTGMDHNTMGQYHGGPTIAYPPSAFSFELVADQLQVSVGTLPNPSTIYTSATITKGIWYDIFWEAKCSTSGTGDTLKCWINGVQVVNTSGAVFPTMTTNGNAGLGYWKIGIYRGQEGNVLQTQAVRYGNLEVVDKSATDISARITSPLAHPTHT